MKQRWGESSPRPAAFSIDVESIADVYSEASDEYAAYADGDLKRLFSFEGIHGYSDRRVWSIVETKLRNLRSAGASSLSILDAGCGPGTWLRRCVMQARLLGFSNVTARGFDIAEAQVHAARSLARDLASIPGVHLTFDVADLRSALPEAASVDITLCLYSVLSHLPVASLPKVITEIARVTKGHFITTVRPIGSQPTIFVDSIEKVHRLQLDHRHDRCEVELRDGRRMALRFHLFASSELRVYFADHFETEDLCGLDIFHARFAPDARWNPTSDQSDRAFLHHLAELEKVYARTPAFMDRATHLLFVGRRRANEMTERAGRQKRRDKYWRGCAVALMALFVGVCSRPECVAAHPSLVESAKLGNECGVTAGFEQVGIASWYGGRHRGRRTASGTVFNLRALTAAHRSLPFGTLVLVQNLANGHCIELRITDRGPYVHGRILDLSQGAAERLGFARLGIGLVGLRIVAPASANPGLSGQ